MGPWTEKVNVLLSFVDLASTIVKGAFMISHMMKIIRTTASAPKNNSMRSVCSSGHMWQTSFPPSDHAEKSPHFWQAPF
eukprot:Skav222249  [mRNA]  locus=scaffold3059:234763:235011:+ [translate_table: standard]